MKINIKKTITFFVIAGTMILTGCNGGDSSESAKNYVANKNSGKLHSINCDSLPYEKNRVYFSSVEEANNAGYTDNHKECMDN
ncbi:MAG: hypothetical protein K2I06_07465 [Ruminococcus sp.]|nr:hypothetical protein [Ruminococcus sp.]